MKTPRCCYLIQSTIVEGLSSQCTQSAEWRIEHHPDSPDDYTESCSDHVGAMLTDAPEHKLYYIGEQVYLESSLDFQNTNGGIQTVIDMLVDIEHKLSMAIEPNTLIDTLHQELNAEKHNVEYWKRQAQKLNNKLEQRDAQLVLIERQLENYKRVMDVVPECPSHGSNCIPCAVEWIGEAKKLQERLEKAPDRGVFIQAIDKEIEWCKKKQGFFTATQYDWFLRGLNQARYIVQHIKDYQDGQ